jgi:DNA-binding NarL/FixJ family response regulator
MSGPVSSVSPLRVLLVEDNEVYRATLALLLHGRDGIEIVGELADGRDVADAAARLRADVVVMDYRLPGLAGDEATSALLAARPATKVVCLTAEATPEERARVLGAGAVALVGKGGPTQELVDAIRSGRAR